MFFRRITKRLRSDQELLWRGYPKRRKRVQVDHHRTRNTESFLQHAVTHEQSSKRMTWLLIMVSVLIIFATLAYALFFSGYFSVRRVIYVNESAFPTITEEMLDRFLVNVRGKHMFLVRTPDIISEILSRNVRIKTINAERILPDTIRISIEEYPVVAHLWQGETNDNVLVNEAGFVVARITNPEEYGQFTIIKTFDSTVWRVDHQAIGHTDLMHMTGLADTFSEQFGLQIERIDYLPPNREAHVHTDKGWSVWFDFNRSVEDSMADLILVFEEARIADEPFSSIDVRVAGKVFVCRKTGPCIPAVSPAPQPFYELLESDTLINPVTSSGAEPSSN